MRETEGTRSNYWLQSLLLGREQEAHRDSILAATNDAGFMTRPIWVLNHRLHQYQSAPRMPLTTAESLERRVINIPSSAQLAPESP